MLVPEIGLTPQFEEQVRERFAGANLVCAHSHLGEGERAAGWLAAQSGAAQIVLGTRLAVLMPFRDLGLIVVDEEHDGSYKQQEGLRYSARDVAVRRAQRLGIPVVLGSATPSLETWSNAREGRYALASLPDRARRSARMPVVRTVDTRADKPARRPHLRAHPGAARAHRARRAIAGVREPARILAGALLPRMHLAFDLHALQREPGAAPRRAVNCAAIIAGAASASPRRCPELRRRGPRAGGPGHPARGGRAARGASRGAHRTVDRDSTARKGALREVLDQVRAGEVDVLVGTQMLAKGHDYPAPHAGGRPRRRQRALQRRLSRRRAPLSRSWCRYRAAPGARQARGEVLIQTDFPGHPLYAAVAGHDFERFAERRPGRAPPCGLPALFAPRDAARRVEEAGRADCNSCAAPREPPGASRKRSRSSIRSRHRSSARPASNARNCWCARPSAPTCSPSCAPGARLSPSMPTGACAGRSTSIPRRSSPLRAVPSGPV